MTHLITADRLGAFDSRTVFPYGIRGGDRYDVAILIPDDCKPNRLVFYEDIARFLIVTDYGVYGDNAIVRVSILTWSWKRIRVLGLLVCSPID
jgi:hypothetical protein